MSKPEPSDEPASANIVRVYVTRSRLHAYGDANLLKDLRSNDDDDRGLYRCTLLHRYRRSSIARLWIDPPSVEQLVKAITEGMPVMFGSQDATCELSKGLAEQAPFMIPALQNGGIQATMMVRVDIRDDRAIDDADRELTSGVDRLAEVAEGPPTLHEIHHADSACPGWVAFQKRQDYYSLPVAICRLRGRDPDEGYRRSLRSVRGAPLNTHEGHVPEEEAAHTVLRQRGHTSTSVDAELATAILAWQEATPEVRQRLEERSVNRLIAQYRSTRWSERELTSAAESLIGDMFPMGSKSAETLIRWTVQAAARGIQLEGTHYRLWRVDLHVVGSEVPEGKWVWGVPQSAVLREAIRHTTSAQDVGMYWPTARDMKWGSDPYGRLAVGALAYETQAKYESRRSAPLQGYVLRKTPITDRPSIVSAYAVARSTTRVADIRAESLDEWLVMANEQLDLWGAGGRLAGVSICSPDDHWNLVDPNSATLSVPSTLVAPKQEEPTEDPIEVVEVLRRAQVALREFGRIDATSNIETDLARAMRIVAGMKQALNDIERPLAGTIGVARLAKIRGIARSALAGTYGSEQHQQQPVTPDVKEDK